MPAAARSADVLVDTSAAVPLVVTGHEASDLVTAALQGRTLGLAGHAAFETFSVPTRLPGEMRRSPSRVAELIARSFPGTVHLSAQGATRLLESLAVRGIAGGAVYDALVGATAAEHRLPLATRDARALDTYRALSVDVELLG